MASQRAALQRLRQWLTSGMLPEELATEQAIAFATLAERHGLAPLLDEALAGAAPPWAGIVAAGVRSAHRASLAASLRRLDVARRVLRRLEAAGVPALPLKGAAVAEVLYDSPAQRPMGDVDVLVLDAWRSAVEALLREGYAASHQADHALCLLDPETGDVVELHHSVTSCPGLFPLDAGALWRRRRAGTGQVPWLPDPADGLIMLALHAAFQHGLALRLGQYLDFRRTLERESLDLGELATRARASGANACLGVALAAARLLVGARPPEALAAWLDAGSTPGQRALVARVARAPEDWLDQGPAALAQVRWQVSAGRRSRLLLLTLAPPQPGTGASRAAWLRRWLGIPRRALALAPRLLRRR